MNKWDEFKEYALSALLAIAVAGAFWLLFMVWLAGGI